MNAAVVKAAITTAVRGRVLCVPVRSLNNPKVTPWNVKYDYPYYHRYIITPPRNYIWYWEKVFWGVFIAAFTLSVPAWIVYHWRDYGSHAEEE